MASFGYTYNVSYPSLVINLPLGVSTAVSENFTTTLTPKWYSRMGMEWEVPADWGNVVFNVFSSTTEEGLYTKMNGSPLNTPFYVDYTGRAFSKYNNTYYKLEAVFPNGQKVQSPPYSVDGSNTPWVRLRKEEITRREWLLLRKFVGIQSYLFKKKYTGDRCPTCWNSDSKRVMMDQCPTCFGTSWDGGYWDPLETLFQYEVTPNDAVLTYKGVVEPNTIQAWTINMPTINDLDIIVRWPDKRIYRVEKIIPTELQTVTVRQQLVLSELSKESVEFGLLDRI